MSRLEIMTKSRAQTVLDGLCGNMERRLAVSPTDQCPVELVRSFLALSHAQSCGKCVPCRIGLGKLDQLLGQVLDGTATEKTIELLRSTSASILDSADCAVGYDAASRVLDSIDGFRDDFYEQMLKNQISTRLRPHSRGSSGNG